MMRGMMMRGDEGMTDFKYTGIESSLVNLDDLDITVHKVLELGIILEAAMQNLRVDGSEDFSDAFDSIGVLLQYASAQMLWQVYKDDENMEKEFFIKPALVNEAQMSIISLDSFNWGLVQRLEK
jgi:hypothetical protein